MDYAIDKLVNSEAEKVQEDTVRIYRRAFEQAPYHKSEEEVVGFRQNLSRHLTRPGFHFIAARDPITSQMVGFTYGYSGKTGQWWHDIVEKAMHPRIAALWMVDNFELVELAVLPTYQGRGIGGLLHDRLMAEQTHPRAILSTLQNETAAMRLYRNRGWVTLLNKLRFPSSNRVYSIMGIDLTKRRSGS
jgi:ribosomal protein S18 acetylase RimI-like enzyme